MGRSSALPLCPRALHLRRDFACTSTTLEPSVLDVHATARQDDQLWPTLLQCIRSRTGEQPRVHATPAWWVIKHRASEPCVCRCARRARLAVRARGAQRADWACRGRRASASRWLWKPWTGRTLVFAIGEGGAPPQARTHLPRCARRGTAPTDELAAPVEQNASGTKPATSRGAPHCLLLWQDASHVASPRRKRCFRALVVAFCCAFLHAGVDRPASCPNPVLPEGFCTDVRKGESPCNLANRLSPSGCTLRMEPIVGHCGLHETAHSMVNASPILKPTHSLTLGYV